MKILRLFLLMAAVGFMLSCVTFHPVQVGISEIGTCEDVDMVEHSPVGINDTFPADVEKIFVYYDLDTNMTLQLTYRWYQGQELVFECDASDIVSGYNFGWLSRREGVDEFPTGQYRVEIVLDDTVIRDVSFEVVPTE